MPTPPTIHPGHTADIHAATALVDYYHAEVLAEIVRIAGEFRAAGKGNISYAAYTGFDVANLANRADTVPRVIALGHVRAGWGVGETVIRRVVVWLDGGIVAGEEE